MKKLLIIVSTLLFVFTLSSCTEEEIDITIVVYSATPTDTIEDLETLPQVLVNELAELSIAFDRVVVQTSNDLSAIESSLIDGTVDMAILDTETSQITTLTKVLSVARDEQDHRDGDMDHTTYQKAIVVAPTVNGETFKTTIDSTPIFSALNGLNVCTTEEDESLIEEYAISLGALTIDDITITNTTSLSNEVYENLADGTCDLGIVILEEWEDYSALWNDNESTIDESLTVLYTYEPIPYGGLYVSDNQELEVTNALMQAFIQMSSHSSNKQLLDVLGHDGYYVLN